MKQRLSNIELLRIVAMFFVLVRHANFYALGMPTPIEAQANPSQTFLMSFLEIFAGVGVNVFVLISGYFGIRGNNKGLFKFIYQCLFFSCGIYLLLLSTGIINISFLGLAECFYLRKINWFPKAYLCLYILSPILNSFVEHSSERQLRVVLINYFIFQTIFGCISDSTTFISFGYSTVSFIGLYLLARYVRLYSNEIFRLSKNIDFCIYCLISLMLSYLAYEAISHGALSVFYRINAYCNPLVIMSSLCLFLCFSKINIKSRGINKIAASSFAVYLLHSNPNVIERFYIYIIQELSKLWGGIFYIFIFLIGVYILAIMIDQMRIFSWNKLWELINKISHKNFKTV